MGVLLREVLKCLCGGEIGWSYAVFWKIGCQNPALLIWEEGHHESSSCSGLSGISGLESTELIIKEWEAHWNRPGDGRGRADDRVGVLVNKMMMQQVHVVGRGVVGRAAFTGDHQWILQKIHMDKGYLSGSLSESLVEVQNQFLAGIQTIAVIPVLAHGVVQLGSTQLIMENMEFINHVKSLFMQLGNVPGALLSDNTIKSLDQNVQVPTSVVIPESTDRPVHAHAKMAARPAPFNGENYNPQILESPASTYCSQPSCSVITQIHGTSTDVSAAPLTCNMVTMAEPLGDLFQRKISPIVKHNLPHGSMGTQVIFSSPSAQLNQWIYNSSSGITHGPSVVRSGVSCRSFAAMEKQTLSGIGLQEPPKNDLPASKNAKTHHLLSHGCTIPNSVKDSVIVSLLGRSGLPNTGNGHQILGSIPHNSYKSANHNSSYTPLQGIGLESAIPSHMRMLLKSNLQNHSNSSHAHSGEPQPSHPSDTDEHNQATWIAMHQKIEKDLFQALSIPLADSFEHVPQSRVNPGFLQDCEASSSRSHNAVCKENGAFTADYVETVEGSIAYEPVHRINENPSDALVQSRTGDDLFSALGLDRNNLKQVHGSWDEDIFINGLNANTENLNTDFSTCITEQDVAPFFGAMNDGISESGIFSETITDHLLDVVVSKIHSVSKQNSDDTVSCKTTLSKICGSTLESNSSTHDQVDISEKMQEELFGLSAALVKAEIAGSGPLKSACSVDKTGECSQTDGKYKSQISLWVENGQNMKNDSIASANSKKVDDTGKPNRKRPRPGESSRPRPKDRQMIQDRVKELREIVPNGAKCSIDALLERTIKHMLFLQSVTKHADKLKQTGESKIIGKEGGLLLKDSFEGGATWAFEVGSQSMVCPIIVEDLIPPRQMLVEMLCEERGFFLEIADIIRGLGLTILKGVMEAHHDKVWARFAVEANRDVTRTEIFLSLVPLLEETGKSSSAPNGIDSGNMVTHIFHQSSIPATGLVNSLQ